MEAMDRTERLLVMILLQLMRDVSQAKKIYQLNLAGLTNIEIANILETTPQVVSQTVYSMRKGGKQKKVRKTRRRT